MPENHEPVDMEAQGQAPASSPAVPVMGAVIGVLLVALLITILWGADVFEDDDDSGAPVTAAPAPVTSAPTPTPTSTTVELASGLDSQVGPRPYYLVDRMPEGALKNKLQECKSMPLRKSEWSIGHRGAPLMFPEHTVESYRAAARQGAGIIECDVTFTADQELVCRHAECDLHTTTNILATPLAEKCATPFTPATDTEDAKAKCCASALTLAEFRTLHGKMDGANAKGKTVAEYMDGTPKTRTDLYSMNGTLLTHKESIALFKSLGVKMTPELKGPDSTMPAAFTRTQFIQKAIAEYTDAGVPSSDVFMQSFLWTDIEELLKSSVAAQTTYLDSRTYNDEAFVATSADFEAKYAAGLRYVAPAVNGLVALDGDNNMIETDYSKLSKAAGLKIISWTMERSDWYYNTVDTYAKSDRYYMHFIDFLAQTVKVTGLFSDWPATTTFYANCMGTQESAVQLGPRPYYLVDRMPEGALKNKLQECKSMPLRKSEWSIGHRGAPLMFPEHTVESYRAAARQGAGIIECDVTFTADKELVCRHAECDLHTTTNILATPLAEKCATPFTPATDTEDAKAKCCASALTLAEFRTLHGKMDGANAKGKTVAEYMDGTPKTRTDLYSMNGRLLTHKESIALFKSLGVKMTPELKGPDSTMPAAFTRTQFIQKAIAEYTDAGVPSSDVFMQSFLWTDIEELLKSSVAAQTTYLDSRTYDDEAFVATSADFEAKYAAGLRYVAPAVNGLVALDSSNNMIETDYSKLSKAAGLKIISWTAERSDWYYNSVSTYVTSDRYYMHFIDFLAQTVKVTGLFSDWPATTTFYANCMITHPEPVQVGPRPYYLVDRMPEGALKTRLEACKDQPIRKSEWSIGHRGAPLMFPEHTVESYRAAARQGAGIIECDVTFTADKELVCRHAECDLHTTTNILATPLAAKCATPFTPATDTEDAKAKCCASALTLAEFRTLHGKMDGANAKGKTVAEYMDGTPKTRTDLYSMNGTLLTHKESIALFKSLGVKMTPELKGPDSTMPAAFTRTQFIQKAIAEYTDAGVPSSDVFMQSFLWTDIEELLKSSVAAQTTYLDSRTYNDEAFVATSADFEAKYAAGLRYVAPAVNGLVALDGDNNMIETDYSKLSKAAGLKIISWTAERSDWYYNSVSTYVTSDRYYMHFIDFLAQTVKVTGLFSDWPATTTFYASCLNL